MTISLVTLKDYLPQYGFVFTDVKFVSQVSSQHDTLLMLFQSFYYLKSNINKHQQFTSLIESYFNKIMQDYDASDLTEIIIQLIEHLKSSHIDVQKINGEIDVVLLQFCQEIILCQQKVKITKQNDLLDKIAEDLNIEIHEFYPTYKLLLLLSFYHNRNKINISPRQQQELESLVDNEFQFSIILTAKTQIESTGLPKLYLIEQSDQLEVKMIKQLLQHPNVNNKDLIKQFSYSKNLPTIQQIQEFDEYSDEIVKIMMQFRKYIDQNKMQQAIYKCNQLIYLLQSPVQLKHYYYYYSFLLFLNKKNTFLTFQRDDNAYQEFLIKNVQRDEFITDFQNKIYLQPNFKVLLLIFCTVFQTDFDQFILDQLLIDMEELPSLPFDPVVYQRDLQRGRQSPLANVPEDLRNPVTGKLQSPSPEPRLAAPGSHSPANDAKDSFFSQNVDRRSAQNDENTFDLTKTAPNQLLYQITHPNIEIDGENQKEIQDYQILVFNDEDSSIQKFIKAYLSQNIYKIHDIEQKSLPESLQHIYSHFTSKEAFENDFHLEEMPVIQNTTFTVYSLWDISDLIKNDVLFEDFVIENCHKRFNCENIYNKYIIDGCSFMQIVSAGRMLDQRQKISPLIIQDYGKWYQEPTSIQKRLDSKINAEKVEEVGDNIIGYLHEIATSGVIQLDRIQTHVEKVTQKITNLENTVHQIQARHIKPKLRHQNSEQQNIKLVALRIALQNIKNKTQ